MTLAYQPRPEGGYKAETRIGGVDRFLGYARTMAERNERIAAFRKEQGARPSVRCPAMNPTWGLQCARHQHRKDIRHFIEMPYNNPTQRGTHVVTW